MCYQKNDLIGTVLEMCGRYASAASLEEVTRRFGVVFPHNLRPRWNVAPSQNTFVIARDGRQKTVIRAAWGLRPTLSRKTILINARMETANKKPTFSDAFLHSRCIIVASGWDEWSAPQTPWYIRLRESSVMAMAGLLFRFGLQSRFVIMTSAADGGLAEIHHRQPLVLGAGDEDEWLNGPADRAAALCKVAPANWFNWYRVSSDVGNVAIDHSELAIPLKGDAQSRSKPEQNELFI